MWRVSGVALKRTESTLYMKYSLPSECGSLLNSFTLGLVRPTTCRSSLYCKVYCWIAFYILENILFILFFSDKSYILSCGHLFLLSNEEQIICFSIINLSSKSIEKEVSLWTKTYNIVCVCNEKIQKHMKIIELRTYLKFLTAIYCLHYSRENMAHKAVLRNIYAAWL